jgi:hypothetical protein
LVLLCVVQINDYCGTMKLEGKMRKRDENDRGGGTGMDSGRRRG